MIQQGLALIGLDAALYRLRWLKWALVAVAVLAAAWLGLNGPNMYMFGRSGLEFFLFALVMLIGAVLVFYRLELGVIAIVFTSFFVRFSLATGSATQIPVSLLVSGFVVAVWILSMLVRGQVRLARGDYVLPALLFILISLLSVPYSWLLFSPDVFGRGGSGRSGLGFGFVQIGGVTLMVLLPLVMLMTANVLRTEGWFKAVFGLMVIVAIPELLQRVGIFGVAFGTFQLQTGASYALWVVALSASQGLFNDALRPWQRAVLLGLTGIWLYYGAELGVSWLSGWLPAFAAFMFLVFMRSRRLFFIVLVFLLIIFAFNSERYIDNIWIQSINEDSNRLDIARIIIFDLTLTKTNFFFGAGPAGYLPVYEYYYPNNAWVSHNNYVDIFAEVGLIGFSLFMWLHLAIFRTGWEQRLHMPTGFLTGFNYGVLAGFIGTLVAMGLGDWHIPFVYNIGIPGFDFAVYGWLLIGAMLGLRHLSTKSSAPNLARA